MTKQVVDPWLLDASGQPDPFAGTIDFSMRPEDAIDPDGPVLEQIPNLNPEIVTTPTPTPEPTPAPVAVDPEPEPDSQVFEVEDGTVTLEKERGQWKATLVNAIGGNPQIYWGKNKNDLLLSVMKAQIHATKKIREQNLKIKFGSTPAPVVPSPLPKSRQLTAEETFEIKTLWESDPDKALESWFEKKTGKPVEQWTQSWSNGDQAALELQIEAVNKEFLVRNPSYYPDAKYENFAQLVKWVSKYKLGRIADDTNPKRTLYELAASEVYTVQNLEEAFEDLNNDGLLIKAPKAPRQVEPTPPVAVQPTEPTPAPRPDSRIVSVETRPRAALGLRSSDVTPAATPDAPKAPSAEDLDSMSDEQIAQLLTGVRRQRIQSRRS